MSYPVITAIEVVVPTDIHDLSNSHVSVVKVNLEWNLSAGSRDVNVGSIVSIPEARQWIEGLLEAIEIIEEEYA